MSETWLEHLKGTESRQKSSNHSETGKIHGRVISNSQKFRFLDAIVRTSEWIGD